MQKIQYLSAALAEDPAALAEDLSTHCFGNT